MTRTILIKKQYKLYCILCVSLAIFLAQLLFTSKIYSQEACGLMPSPNFDDIHCLGVNVDDALFIGTWGDGLYKTTNDALTVTKTNSGLRGIFISSICFSKTGTIYVATADSGVYKSVNGGNTWTEITNGVPLFGKAITCITGTTPAKDKVYLGTFGQGIFISQDGGATWKQTNEGIFNLDINALAYNNDNKVIAGVYGNGIVGGLYDNLDSGDSAWARRSNGISIGSKYINGFGKDKLGNLMVAINGNTAWTTDVTNVWAPICFDNSTITDTNFTCITYANPKPLATKYDETIGTRSKGIWYFDNRVYENWQQSTSVKSGGVNAIARRSNGTLYAAMAGRGLLMSSDNGLTWTDIGSFDYRSSSSLVTAGYGGLVYVSPRPGGVYRSIDYGLSWSGNLYTRTIIASGPRIITMRASNNKIYLSDNDTVNSGLRFSLDSGATWAYTSTPAKNLIISIAVCPTNTNVVYCLASIPGVAGQNAKVQLYKSTNGGVTLNTVGAQILGDQKSKIVSINDTTVYIYENGYVTGAVPNLVISNRIFGSTNSGTSWTPTTPFNVSNTTIHIQDLAIDSSNNVYAAGSDGLYLKPSGSSTFAQINNLNKKLSVDDSPFINRLAVKSNNEIYVGFDGNVGVYYTANGGSNWTNLNASYNTATVRDMTVGTEGDVYFVASAAYRIVNPSKMDKPTMIQPLCESKGVLLKPIFIWSQSVRANMYELYVCTEFDTLSPIVWDLQSPTTYTSFHNLLPNTTYLWKVRGKANGSYSPWTDWCSFTTQAGPPKLLYPANIPDTLSKGIPVLCQFNWNKADNVDRYHIQVGKDSLFKTIVFDKDSIADSTYLNTVSQKMPPLTKLWWRAMCWNTKYPNVSGWSKPNQFMTTLAPPKLINPLNNSATELPSLTFKWDSVNTATFYELQVALAKDTLFTNPAPYFDHLTADVLSQEVTSLDYNVKYCWRMKAHNEDGASAWSDPFCFTTSLQGPANAVPANMTSCLDTVVGFSWSKVPKATSYIIQIGTDTLLTTKLVNDTIKTNSYIKTFKMYTAYYWRVSALVDQTQGKWIDTRVFKTGLEKAITKSPTNLEKLNSFPVELRWNDVNNAKSYTVRLAKDKSLSTNLQTMNNITVNSKTVFGLDTCVNYFWSVQANTPDCDGTWSDTLSFKVCPIGDVNDYIAQEYNVNIYPNPFTSTVNINFITKQTAWTTVSIYNSAGSKVVTLFDKELNFGEHTLYWTPTGIAKGIYYLNIKTKDFDIMREINFK